MRVVLLGVSHRDASVELREQLALSGSRLDRAVEQFRACYQAAEVVILSTCNRTELYVAKPTHEPPLLQDLQQFLARFCGVDVEQLVEASIHREGEAALAHLFRVACGLESMVLGEPQILGQIKRAYEQSIEYRTVGPVLHKVFQNALAIGKRARHETGIGIGRMSIGSVAVDFARQIFERFDDKTVVGVGAGEMAKLMLRHLEQLRPARLWVVSRSAERAGALIERLGVSDSRGGARDFGAFDELLVEADIVLTSTGASEPIITVDLLKPLLRRRRYRPLFVIDIAVPRDVAADVGSLKGVYLYNIDDLQRVVSNTQEDRAGETRRCEAMLQSAVEETISQVQNREVGQLIHALREQLHELGRIEQERALRKLSAASPEDLAHALPGILQQHTHRLINKILHVPLRQLEKRDDGAPVGYYASALRRLFALDERSMATLKEQQDEAADQVSKERSTVEVRAKLPDRSERVTAGN